jgi:phenylpropionate dioxygenase-like ring-hydroxylating dioxygenase large terminal subunit
VRACPLLERQGARWIWMVKDAQADPGKLPDFSATDERAGWSRIEGCLHVHANDQLLIDNLLDLSHAPFLRPFPGSGAPPSTLLPDSGFAAAFRDEDEPMIEACQRNMGTSDLMSLKPVLLQTDASAVRARRIVKLGLDGSAA